MKDQALMKTITGALAALLSFLLSAPSSLHQAAGVALWLLGMDTASGLWLARRTGSMTSSAYRTKLKDKLVCYAMILGLCAAVGVLARTWAWPVAGFWALCAGEGISLAETLRSGMKLSNAAWTGPVGELLDKLMGTFDTAKDVDEKSLQTEELSTSGDSPSVRTPKTADEKSDGA